MGGHRLLPALAQIRAAPAAAAALAAAPSSTLEHMLPHHCRHSYLPVPLPCRYLVEDEVEQFMIRQLQDPKHEAYEDFKRKTKQVRGRSKGSGDARH